MKSGGQLGGVCGEIRWTSMRQYKNSRLGVLTCMVKCDLFWFMWQTDNHHPLQPLFGSKFFPFVLHTETTQSLLYFFPFVLHTETTQSLLYFFPFVLHTETTQALLYFFPFVLHTETTQSLLYFGTNSDPPLPLPQAEGRKS